LFRNEKPDYEFWVFLSRKKNEKKHSSLTEDLILITLLLGVNFLYHTMEIAKIFNLNSFKNVMITIVAVKYAPTRLHLMRQFLRNINSP
jgi:hypothetical protein